MTNEQQITALRALVSAIVDSVKEAGAQGAPGGILYAAMMAHGCTLQQFQSLMQIAVRAGKLRQSGELYFAL